MVMTDEKTLSRILAYGTCLVSIFVMTGTVTDPVNAPKLLVLGMCALASFFVSMVKAKKILLTQMPVLVICLLFLVTSISSVIFSNAPYSQLLYGAYGRNSGFLTYLFLLGLFVSALSLTRKASYVAIVISLLIAGAVNTLYNGWVLLYGDFIGWTNPYGNILGTFGNPNFIGAFYGMVISVIAAVLLGNSNIKVRLILAVFLAAAIYQMYMTHAIQGRLVSSFGLLIVIYCFLRHKISKTMSRLYLALIGGLGILATLGALQIGPAESLIYKTSVSLRGQYWKAAFNTGMDNLFTGVGFDTFGDFYRLNRDSRALELPGVNTVTNAAHNVPLDLFAYGGAPLALTYAALMSSVLIYALQTLKSLKSYDWIFTSIFVCWMGYQAQSIISINQIGIAAWGWLLSGALVGYARMVRVGEQSMENPKKPQFKDKQSFLPTSSLVLAGLVAGAIVASPPVNADIKWMNAQKLRSGELLEQSLIPSYLNPQNSTKYLNSIQAYEESQLFELAHKFAEKAVDFNPNAFELWKVFYLLKATTQEEKANALANMQRLDPKNPDVTSVK